MTSTKPLTYAEGSMDLKSSRFQGITSRGLLIGPVRLISVSKQFVLFSLFFFYFQDIFFQQDSHYSNQNFLHNSALRLYISTSLKNKDLYLLLTFSLSSLCPLCMYIQERLLFEQIS